MPVGKWVKDKQWPLQRTIRMDVVLPLAQYRRVDWDSLPQTDIANVKIDQLSRDLKYPPAALRMNLETTLDYECAIWPDHSTSCRVLGAETDEASRVFTSAWLEQAMLRQRIDPQLKDGTPSAGYRYRGKMVMQMPD